MKALTLFLLGVWCVGMCPAGVCAGQAETQPGESKTTAVSETKNIVQGKVVQEPGGEGIRKVRVILAGGPQQYEAATDGTGQFKIEGMDSGVYQLQLQRAGYVADLGTRRERTITVGAGQNTKDLLFRMRATGVITGKVVDLDGDPLRDVSVVAIANDSRAARRSQVGLGRAGTNDLGEYRIADLEPGKYVVQAIPPENQAPAPSAGEKGPATERLVYVMTYFPGTMDERQATPVEVPAGGTASANFAVQASHAYRVSGTVVGLGGGQAMAQLFLLGKDGQREQQILGEGGKFEFPRLPAGTYRAQLLLFSGSVNAQAPSAKMQTISTLIEVHGADVVGLQLQVDTGGDVNGKFRTDDQEKINWAELNVSLLTVPESEEETAGLGIMTQPGNAQVNEDGSFEIKDAPETNCQLAVGAGSEKFRDYYTKSVLLGGREVVDTGFAVGPETVLDVVVSAKGAGIEGTVVDEDGKPVAGAAVVTVPSSGKLGRPDAYQADITNESGHFLLRGMNPGEFMVLAFEEMRENYRAPEFAKKYEGKTEKVKLEEGEKKSVIVKLITKKGKGP